MDFVAIDFETANYKRNSACSIGMVSVKNGKIVGSYSTLINPKCEFVDSFIKLHSISAEMVKDAPAFNEVWPEIRNFIAEGPLIAHNSSFDMGVLTACLDQFEIDVPELDYACTLRMSKQLWPDFEHHNAMSDATACAELALKLLSSVEERSGNPFRPLSQFGSRGRKGPTEDEETCAAFYLVDYMKENKEKVVENDEGLCLDPLKGLFFVLEGEAEFYSRDELIDYIEVADGSVEESLSEKTNYVVVGEALWKEYRETGKVGGELKTAIEQSAASGKPMLLTIGQLKSWVDDDELPVLTCSD